VGGPTQRNQSIVVSGESGAGKTEAAKHVMSFLIEANSELNRNLDAAADVGDAIRKVLLDSNCIFESFGNAKTVRNDNSSRFGKYIKLQYTEHKRLVSANTETFLLEKSRLVNVGTGERNYHVFYQLLTAAAESSPAACAALSVDASALRLHAAADFRMLADAAGAVLKAEDDGCLPQLCAALRTVGCSDKELAHMWTLLAAVLHMGNIDVTSGTATGGSGGADQNEASSSGGNQGLASIASRSMPLQQLAELLGVSVEMFENRLITQRVRISTRSSVTVKHLNPIDVTNNIAALSKWIYSSLFSWLVKKINFAHCSVSSHLSDIRAVKFIGILDIFGFEILQTNSFEQLCINFTNERYM
jgi:myosin heavy subunit